MKLYYLKWFLCLFLFANAIFSAEDVSIGKSKAMICSACHGVDGVSINQDWPHLAGQHASYIVKQLQDYKAGVTRSDPSMTPFVANLTIADMQDIAKFYASLRKASCNKAIDLKRGMDIYRRGDVQKGITACIACHGPDGSGNSQAGFPLLSGQNAKYTIAQLKAFKDKKRQNDISAIMHDITGHMSDVDMQAVADYICAM